MKLHIYAIKLFNCTIRKYETKIFLHTGKIDDIYQR